MARRLVEQDPRGGRPPGARKRTAQANDFGREQATRASRVLRETLERNVAAADVMTS